MPTGKKNSEEKCLMRVQRTARERGEKYTWKQSWRTGREQLNIQNQEMQISQKLAEMFKLVLNTLEAKAGNYRQTCFVWPAQCFKQSWIRCQHIKIGSFFFFFLILSFPRKLEIGRTRKTSHLAAVCWTGCQLPTFGQPHIPGVSLGSTSLLHAPDHLPDPAGICIGRPSFEELRPKVSLSVFTLTLIPATKTLCYLGGVKKGIR